MAPAELPEAKEPEPLEPKLAYIAGLPRKQIRGLELPYDDEGYYLVWPGGEYWKQRQWRDDKGRYRNPSGHRQTLFRAQVTDSAVVLVVEGEINALSAAVACPEFTVLSPGGASQFNQSGYHQMLTDISKRGILLIITDPDPPGIKAALEIAGRARGLVPKVATFAMQPDANDLLVAKGRDELRRVIHEALEGNLD